MSTRTLVLLRHAHAEPAKSGQADLERGLSAEGRNETAAAARWVAEQGLAPDRVLCSPALRTRQTLEGVFGERGADLRLEPRIYEATPGTLIDVLEAHGDAAVLLLVGHNPGMETLLALLCSGRSGEFRGMPPCAIAVVEVQGDAALEPGTAQLSRFWWP